MNPNSYNAYKAYNVINPYYREKRSGRNEGFKVSLVCSQATYHYGTAPVDTCRPQNCGSHDYLRAHKESRRMSRPLIQDSSVRVLFPRYKGNLT